MRWRLTNAKASSGAVKEAETASKAADLTTFIDKGHSGSARARAGGRALCMGRMPAAGWYPRLPRPKLRVIGLTVRGELLDRESAR